MNYSFAAGCVVISLICAQSPPALGQASSSAGTAPAAAESTPPAAANGLDEIIVTARRRSEGAESVPATISALGSEALTELGIHSEEDLQSSVSGLTVRAGISPNQLNYSMRGESLDAYSGSPPGVIPYTNEVPITANTATAFYDLENVQVLKGPQGTLFGRNSTGGAVLFQTARPKNDWDGYASIQYGNLDRVIAEGATDLPIAGDTLMVRVAGTYTSGGAFVRNLYQNGDELGDQRVASGRVTILYHPIDGLTNTTTVQYSHFGGTNQPGVPYYIVPCGQQGGATTCTFEPNVPGFQTLISGKSGLYPGYPSGYVYPGGLAGLIPYLHSLGNYVVDQNAQHHHRVDEEFLINTTTLDLPSGMTLKNIFGFNHASNFDQYDNDASPYPTLQAGDDMGNPSGRNGETLTTQQISDELQLQGEALGGGLSYLFGLFYSEEADVNGSPITGAFIAPPDTVGGFNVYYHARGIDDSYAVFTQATYKITDQLNLTGGVRQTWDRLSNVQLSDSVFGVGQPQHTWEDDPSWTVSLDYHWTPELMTYVTTRGSWRTGNYNAFAPPIGTTVTADNGGNYFQQETVHDLEGGIKFDGRLADIPFRFNADVYNSWIKNLQKTAFVVIAGNVSSATVNVPAAQVLGVEGDFQVRPASWLRLGGSVSFTDGRFTRNEAILYGLPAAFGPFGDIPRWSGTVSADITQPLAGGAGSLNFHTDAYAQSYFYFSNLDATLTPGTRLPSYTLLNTRLDWVHPFGTKLTASLFAKNLTNKLYYVGGAAAAQENSTEVAAFGPPRTYGGILRYEW
jgi:iron complex outermembrane receptor protein